MNWFSKMTLVRGVTAVLCAAALGLAQAAPILSVNAGAATQGSPFTVYISISNANDLFAFQLDLGFDPTLLSATSVSEGPFLQTAGATFLAPGLIDNTNGTITGIADALVGFVPGATGSGVLLAIDFDALAAGTSALTITNPLFLDSTLVDITTGMSVNGGAVTVAPRSTVPEPASLSLALAGLAAMAALSRRRRGSAGMGQKS
jgi:general secretion pathway protein D